MRAKKEYEIVIHGRGGQGAKTTAEILAQAALLEGKKVQAFPEFGPERSGAPMRSYVRISESSIRTHQPIVTPDCVLVLDETILDVVPVAKDLSHQEPVIVNSRKTRSQLAQKLKNQGKASPVDASGISQQIIGENRPNTVILGKFCFVSEVIKVKNVVEIFRRKYEGKLGKEKTEKNLKAIREAYGV